MAYENILYSESDYVATITLNRPERRNALSLQTMRELIQCLDTVAASRGIRSVILAAEGHVFCSGHDLTELRGRPCGSTARSSTSARS